MADLSDYIKEVLLSSFDPMGKRVEPLKYEDLRQLASNTTNPKDKEFLEQLIKLIGAQGLIDANNPEAAWQYFRGLSGGDLSEQKGKFGRAWNFAAANPSYLTHGNAYDAAKKQENKNQKKGK